MKFPTFKKGKEGERPYEYDPFLEDEEEKSDAYRGDIQRPQSPRIHFKNLLNVALLLLLVSSNSAWWVRSYMKDTQQPGSSCVRPQLVWCKIQHYITYRSF